MSKKFTSTVAGASVIIIFFTVLGRGLGLIREAAFAHQFGLKKEFDIYLIGAVIPVVVNSIITYLGQNYFIPNYKKIKFEKNSDEESSAFFTSILMLFIIGGILISLILFLFSGSIIEIYLGNSSNVKAVAENVLRLFLITLPLTAAISILSAFLQSEFEFKSPVISQLWLNISVIILVIFFSKDFNIYSIPLGYILGTIIQLIYLSLKVRGKIKINFKSIRKIRFIGFSYYSILLTVLIEIIGQLYIVIDRFFYNRVDMGGIAALNYAGNIFILPISIISMAFSTALFPKFSQAFFSKEKGTLIESFKNSLIINSFIFIPIAIILIFFGDTITKIFYQRGEFTGSDTVITFNILRIYALCLIFYSTYTVVNKLLYGINAIKFLTIISIIGLSTKIITSFVLVENYRQNGLAMSSAIAYTLIFILAFSGSIKMIKANNKTSIFFGQVLLLINGLFSLLIVKILFELVNVKNDFIQIIQIICFIFIYVINLIFIKHKSLLIIKDTYFSWKLTLPGK